MKRFFLSSICTLAVLLFAGNTMIKAQQTAPATSNKQVTVVIKTVQEDGTVTIKKKSVEKGQDVQAYLDEFGLQDATGKTEINIEVNQENGQSQNHEETIFFLRKGNIQNEAHKDMMKDMDELKIVLRNHEFMETARLEEKKTFLGVYPESSEKGVEISGVVSDSGAEAAGLQADDVLTAINGNAIKTTGDLRKELDKYQPEDEVTISYLRNGTAMETKAKLSAPKAKNHNYNYNYNYNYDYNYNYSGKSERDPCKVFFGVYVGSYGEGLEGVGVSGIVEGGEWPAEKAGLKRGDRIIAIDNIPVNSHNELVTERDKHKPGQNFTFTILRESYPIDIDAQFKVCPNQPAEEPVVEKITEVTPQPQPIEQINNTLELEELNAYPNPTFGLLNVKFRGEAVPTKMMITDINGKVVHQENLPNFDGYYNRELDISSGTPGTLMLSVRQDEKVVTMPLILLNRA
jgi:predicted metalloprotease with PDZ domain